MSGYRDTPDLTEAGFARTVEALQNLLPQRTDHEYLAARLVTRYRPTDRPPLVDRLDAEVQLAKVVGDYNRLADRQRQLEADNQRLTTQVNASQVQRVIDALAAMVGVREQRSAKHDTDCWQRHTACLAARVHKALVGEPS